MPLRRIYDLITSEPYLRDSRTGLQFRRTVGALAWPYGDRPGCLLTLGELRNSPNALGARRHLHVLRELRSADTEELLDEAVRMRDEYLCPHMVTPADDPRMVLLDEYNDRRRRARQPVLRVQTPAAWRGRGEGLLAYYNGLILRRGATEKSLVFGRDCSARDELARIGSEDMGRAMIEFPGACALCWAVEDMDTQRVPEWGERGKIDAGPADLLGGY